MKQITIIVVDDHPLIRKAWGFTINQDARFRVIAESESAETAFELTKQLCPDIVLMDVNLRGMSGIEATQLIRKCCPGSKIIGLSFHIRPEYANKMIECGASGYLCKSSSPDEIFRAIIEVHNGGIFICNEVTHAPNTGENQAK